MLTRMMGTDRQTDGQTQVTTITLRPKRPRVKNKWKPLIEFRTGNGYFPGNHFNIPSDNKASIKCPLCTHFNLDLFHYFLSCNYFIRFSRKFKVKSVVNTLSFRNVMNNEKTSFNVARFVKEILMSLKEII